MISGKKEKGKKKAQSKLNLTLRQELCPPLYS